MYGTKWYERDEDGLEDCDNELDYLDDEYYRRKYPRESFRDVVSGARSNFAGIGTNKAKRRLNKLAKTNPIAKAVRLAIEAEDRSTQAKCYWGKYRKVNYDKKASIIGNLIALSDKYGWKYGIQKSNTPKTSHIIYFDLPYCGQISWHHSPAEPDSIPHYDGEWDGQRFSTLTKLDAATRRLLGIPDDE